jgi:hypothetical protein
MSSATTCRCDRNLVHTVRASAMSRCWLRFVALALSVLVPAAGLAQQQPSTVNSWQFALTAYGYLPQISGTASFPVAGTSSSFTLNQQDILDHLKMTFMGSFDAHYGSWGVFTDVLYMDLGERKTNFHDFTIGGIGIPAATTADVSLDMKTWIVNVAGEYRVPTAGASTLDLIAGLRYLYIKQRLEWSFTGSLGNLPGAARAGNTELSGENFDGIVGAKGQLRFGTGGRWAIPAYLDLGTGDSHFTWEGATGIAYAFQWGEVAALYRYIDYQFRSARLHDLTVGGPMVGATFRW